MDGYTEPAYQVLLHHRSRKTQKEWMVTKKCKECNSIVLIRDDEFLCSKCSNSPEDSIHTTTSQGNYLENLL